MVTDQYFNHEADSGCLEKVLKSILLETDFEITESIFQGKIYQDNKLGTSIYCGVYEDKEAVLKVQLLPLARSEIQNIQNFNKYNKSQFVRLPEVYLSKECVSPKNPGYIISELITAPKIYNYPLANDIEALDFLSFYKEYKNNTLTTAFYYLDPKVSSNNFSNLRVEHWLKIVETQGKLNSAKTSIATKYFELSNQHLVGLPMVFMHSHLGGEDVFKLPGGQYVLMSNAFFGYRPLGYDLSFHIWFGLKSLRNLDFNLDDAIKYLESCIQGYKNLGLDFGQNDLEKVFYANFLERCAGALIIDLDNQGYDEDLEKHKSHLENLFMGLFEYCVSKLS